MKLILLDIALASIVDSESPVATCKNTSPFQSFTVCSRCCYSPLSEHDQTMGLCRCPRLQIIAGIDYHVDCAIGKPADVVSFPIDIVVENLGARHVRGASASSTSVFWEDLGGEADEQNEANPKYLALEHPKCPVSTAGTCLCPFHRPATIIQARATVSSHQHGLVWTGNHAFYLHFPKSRQLKIWPSWWWTILAPRISRIPKTRWSSSPMWLRGTLVPISCHPCSAPSTGDRQTRHRDRSTQCVRHRDR